MESPNCYTRYNFNLKIKLLEWKTKICCLFSTKDYCFETKVPNFPVSSSPVAELIFSQDLPLLQLYDAVYIPTCCGYEVI